MWGRGIDRQTDGLGWSPDAVVVLTFSPSKQQREKEKKKEGKKEQNKTPPSSSPSPLAPLPPNSSTNEIGQTGNALVPNPSLVLPLSSSGQSFPPSALPCPAAPRSNKCHSSHPNPFSHRSVPPRLRHHHPIIQSNPIQSNPSHHSLLLRHRQQCVAGEQQQQPAALRTNPVPRCATAVERAGPAGRPRLASWPRNVACGTAP
ncbi:hypothetical protein BKA81DRAFT_186926 [Phyllosticta paracitricarpa]|uniref:Uncharacterized protein n=1 Tax=Phyllosticta citricarpa TaxID=55181 RepID=A0ABR1LS12_9PEZI